MHIAIRFKSLTAYLRHVLPLGMFWLQAMANAQVVQPAQWDVNVLPSETNIGEIVAVIFKVEIDDSWHLYSNIQDYEIGPLPAVFEFEPNAGYRLIGEVEPISPKTEYDEVFEFNVNYFVHKAEFRQNIKILGEHPVIKGSYSYQVCTTVDGKCIPGDGTFNLSDKIKVTVSSQPTNTNTATASVQQNAVTSTIKDTITEANKNDDANSSYSHQGVVSSPQTQIEQGRGLKNNPADNFNEGTNQNGDTNNSLWAFMLLAFGSGLAALLTPCVFPMIPLTVSFFGSKNSNNNPNNSPPTQGGVPEGGGGLKKALLYGFFIILIYVVAGTLVARINGPEFANWLSTHWLPNILFFVIFLIFAMAFLGMFELTLPNSWINKMDGLSNKKGALGVFFMAFTLVLISFSCTGPIVGSVLVLSAGGAVIKPVAGMFAFSLALAMPFTLFAAFPKWLQKLPKSGGWLQEVKVVLGFLELALALKFLSVADQVYHWGILNREVYLALWIVIFTLLGFYLLGKIRLPHDSEQRNVSVPKLMLAITVFGFVVYLIPGMVGAPLKPLSGYLPPLTSQEFVMNINLSPSGVENEAFVKTEENKLIGCPKPKYEGMLHLPHGLEGFFDMEQAKVCAKIQDKPIFIDFTGHGCVNCRAMEARVWSDPKVMDILKNDFVIVALYVDEKTELPETEWYESEYDGKTKRTIGKQNADYQITAFTNNAQPFYVLMSPDGEPLVKPKAYDLNIDNFVDFLEEGLNEYQSIRFKN